MDFQNMKRKELQALCKKHSFPANLSNSHMALNLSSLLLHQDQKNKKTSKRGQTSSSKVSVESVQEDDSGMITIRQSKKVRFSDNNEMFEYVKLSYGRKMPLPTKVTLTQTQTKSVMKLKPAPKEGVIRPVVEKGDHIELRSKVQASVAGGVEIPVVKPSVEMSVGKEADHTAESVNEIIVKTVRVTRSSKGKLKASTVDLVPVTTKQQLKKKTSRGVLVINDVDGVESVEEVVEKKRCGGVANDVEAVEEAVVSCPVRVTRSRVQTSVEIPALKSQVNKLIL